MLEYLYGKYSNILKPSHPSYLSAYEDGTDTVFRNVGIWNSDAGELPRRKHAAFRTRRKIEIKNRIWNAAVTLRSSESKKSFLSVLWTFPHRLLRLHRLITLQSGLLLITSALWNFVYTNLHAHEEHNLHFGSSTEHKLAHLKSSQQNRWPEII